VKTLNEIVDASAARFGRKPALIIRPGFRTRTWTYRDLAELVPRVARTLADAGVMRGDRIVIWGVNRPEYGIAFLAALRIGAVLVPLDVNSLTEFARKIVQQTRATAAMSTGSSPASRRASPSSHSTGSRTARSSCPPLTSSASVLCSS